MDHVWGDGVLDSEPLNQNYMTRLDAANLRANEPLIRHFANGGIVQSNYGQTSSRWNDDTSPNFTHPPIYFRKKPEAKFRPWTQADALPLVGVALLRGKRIPGNEELGRISLMIGCGESEVVAYADAHPELLFYSEMLQRVECSIDHGKTWLPCGIQE